MPKPKKRIKLSNKNKFLAGVCGGIAEYFNIDPTFVRIACVLLFLIPPISFVTKIPIILVYIVCWVIFPSE